jgi:hypothetical protein
MRFLTDEESRAWCKGNPPYLDERGKPVQWPSSFQAIRVIFTHEPAGRVFWLSRQLMAGLGYWDESLLWVFITGVFEASQDAHLYYRIRQSYGDLKHVHEAPGHLGLGHEHQDMLTMLQVTMLLGWNAVLFTRNDYGRVFVSNDEYAELAVRHESGLAPIFKEIESAGFKIQAIPAAV